MKIKKNVLLITSLIVLLPIVIGLLLWRQLPEQIATHFDFSGKPDGYSSKFEAVFLARGYAFDTSFLHLANIKRSKIRRSWQNATSYLLDCSCDFYFCTVDGLFGSLWLYENKCF